MPMSACEIPASQAGKDRGEDEDPREWKGKGREARGRRKERKITGKVGEWRRGQETGHDNREMAIYGPTYFLRLQIEFLETTSPFHVRNPFT